jgi:GT2 family glycosyltransferase
MTPVLSISIVHHDGKAMLRDCLRSIKQNPPDATYEILVVDNASTDGAMEMLTEEFPEVQLIRRTRRHGFGDNHNQAMEQMRGKFLFLLNDDTLVLPNALNALLACATRHPNAGVVGARLQNADGSLQPSCYKFPSPVRAIWENLLLTAAFPESKWFGDYRCWAHNEERTVDFVSGAAFLVRREVIEQIGEMDTEFFMYAEETDWQKRMNRVGWTTVFCPDAHIVHFGGRSSEVMPERQFVEFHRSQLKFIRKWHGTTGAVIYRMAMVGGAIVRLTLWGVLGLISARRGQAARQQRETWTRLLRWWLGLGPHAGLRELAEQGHERK